MKYLSIFEMDFLEAILLGPVNQNPRQTQFYFAKGLLRSALDYTTRAHFTISDA